MGLRSSVFSYGIQSVALAAAISVPTHAKSADDAFQQELRRLQRDAQQARKDAEEALDRAKRAEAAINQLLDAPPSPVASIAPVATAPTKPDCSNVPTEPRNVDRNRKRLPPQRVDCLDSAAPTGADSGTVQANTHGLMAYAVDYEVEKDLRTHLNGISDQGPTNDKRNVSFMQIAQPVASRLTIGKGAEAFEASYAYPLARRRAFNPGLTSVRAITSSLTVGFSATFDPDDKTTGLFARDGSFNSDPVGVTLSYGRQYYPWVPLYGKGDTVEARARKFGQALWDQCMKATGAKPGIYGDSPTLPKCEDQDLLTWAFDPNRPDEFKANIDAYNAAFWDKGKDAVPVEGWGFNGGLSTREFEYIDPLAFVPGIVIDPANPRLLSTLSTQKPENGGPFLDEQSPRRWSMELGGYVFRHFAGKIGPLDGLLARIDLTAARRWDVAKSEKEQEFCAFKTAISNVAECKKFNIAAPDDHFAFEPSLNLRTRLKLGDPFPRIGRFVPSLAISPRLGWNSHSGAYRVEIPVYLSGNEKMSELTGGLRFVHIWNDDDDSKNGSVWSVFLSTPFSMDGSKK